MNRSTQRKTYWTLSTICLAVGLLVASAGLRADAPKANRRAAVADGVWIAGDFHNHSRLTDGSYHPMAVMEKGMGEFGLTWFVNSEHGGAFGRDPEGRYWENVEPPVVIKGDERRDKNQRRQMWRWQSLIEYSFPIITEARKSPRFAGKVIMQGMEFNCPGHEHVSVGILADSALPLAEFEYRFDAQDADTSGGPGGKWKNKNTTNDHAKALQAITWLDSNYRGRSWFIVNHPERANKYRIDDFRDFNDAAPQVAFGFEGAPGHHKTKNRGHYAEKSFRYEDDEAGLYTHGGVGAMVARVGGLWDALLGEGRPFFAYANSDFHDAGPDFFPGEYQKTYVHVNGPVTDRAILESLRAGRSFFASGDLVDAVEFTARVGRGQARMGETLKTRKGTDVQVTIRLHDPSGRNCVGDEVSLAGVDLIGGDVTGRISKYLDDKTTPNPAYSVNTNPSTRVLAHFNSGNWKAEGDGWISATYTIQDIDRSMYLRLRGCNLPPGTEGETDADGHPLSDSLAEARGLDGLPEARAELWFYSNPLFIQVR